MDPGRRTETTRGARRRSLASLALVGVSIVVACGCSRTDTVGRDAVETLEMRIAAYETSPSPALAADVEVAFAALDGEIARLEAQAARAGGEAKRADEKRAEELGEVRYDLRNRYARAIVAAKVDAAGEAVRSVGESIGRGLKNAGQKLQDAAAPGPGGASGK